MIKYVGQVKILGYNDKGLLQCKCLCGNEFTIEEKYINNIDSCGCKNRIKEDLTGRKFGDWYVIGYADNRYWKCKCGLCGTIKDVRHDALIKGRSNSCGCNRFKGLTIKSGDTFNNLTVINDTPLLIRYKRKDIDGSYCTKRKWECVCNLCGKAKYFREEQLKGGYIQSCGCIKDKSGVRIGSEFGELKVIDGPFKAHDGRKVWRCRCSCGNIVDIRQEDLIYNGKDSCGCQTRNKMVSTFIDRYGDLVPSRVDNPRSVEQINAVSSKECMIEYILNNFGTYKPSTTELEKVFGITKAQILRYVHKYNIEEYIDINRYISYDEKELLMYIEGMVGNDRVISNDRSVLNGKELDVYIPDMNIAFDFIGNFWHSSKNKDKNYHYNKYKMCADRGIQLIHIFEYEWQLNRG